MTAPGSADGASGGGGTGGGSGGGAWADAVATLSPSVLARARSLGIPTVLGQVASTQDELRRLATLGVRPGAVVIAERQLAGRGRQGRDWDDAARPGASLAMSLLLPTPSAGAGLVPHAVGLALLEAVELLDAPAGPEGTVVTAGRVGLKWPNDVVERSADGRVLRKLAGTLVERDRISGRDVLLVGIGVNVDRRDETLPADRACIAGVLGRAVSPVELLTLLLPALDHALAMTPVPARLLEAYRARCVTFGRDVVVDRPGAPTVVGEAVGIDDEGRLRIMTEEGVVVVTSGTVRDAPTDGARA